MWYQVDEEALDDWRIRRLAKQLGMSQGDAFLLCNRVWCHLYKRGGGLIAPEDIDAVTALDGFGNAMVTMGLGDLYEGGIRIKGDERVERFALARKAQKAKSALGVAARIRMGQCKQQPPGLPGVNPSNSVSSEIGSESGSGSDPEALLAIARARQTAVRTAAQDATAAWIEWFNRRFARSFTVSKAVTKQVGALLAEGFTEKPDMRGVALFLRSQWEGKPDMIGHLVPSTILRTGKFQERLDQAKEWAMESGSTMWSRYEHQESEGHHDRAV